MSSESFSRSILPEVSRTFALNIPVLPEPLDLVVTVAYLLCRIADTIEDESQAPVGERAEQLATFARLVETAEDCGASAERFSHAVVAKLGQSAPAAEVKLLQGTSQVLETLASLPKWTRAPISRCVRTMTEGMAQVSRELKGERPTGLRDLQATLQYCYYVAGTVGEMLTGLFSAYAPDVRAKEPELAARAVAFGHALQLTNILKDVREDLERGYCWLPRDRMAAHGLSAQTLLEPGRRAQAVALLDELIGVARAQLLPALEYTLAIPKEHEGLRLFCLWPLGFAVLTLHAIESNPKVFEPAPVKISRAVVQKVMIGTQERVADDAALRAWFDELSGAPGREMVRAA